MSHDIKNWLLHIFSNSLPTLSLQYQHQPINQSIEKSIQWVATWFERPPHG